MLLFQLFFAMMILNLFVAIILQAFDDTSKSENGKIEGKFVNDFIKAWTKYSIE